MALAWLLLAIVLFTLYLLTCNTSTRASRQTHWVDGTVYKFASATGTDDDAGSCSGIGTKLGDLTLVSHDEKSGTLNFANALRTVKAGKTPGTYTDGPATYLVSSEQVTVKVRDCAYHYKR